MDAKFRVIARACLAAAMLMVMPAVFAADADMAKLIAPSGKLRVALYPGTPTSILDPKAAEPAGVGYELGKALAAKLGVPYEPVVMVNNAEVQEALKNATADLAFTNASPARAKLMDFVKPALIIELGFLVPANSKITSSDNVDQEGMRIGASAHSSSEAALTKKFKHAKVVASSGNGNGAEMLAEGKLDAFATNKASLYPLVAKVPGSKVLADRWGEEHMALAIPKGREQALPYVQTFTDGALSSGLVKAAMDRAGLKGALPANDPTLKH